MAIFDYDRRRAYEYALRWAYRRNPLFFDFSDLGGDCTSFVSQCIFAGCCRMNFTQDLGWYYINIEDRAPAWSGVEFLYDFITTNTEDGPFGSESDVMDLRAGDVIQLADGNGDWYHTLLVIGRDGGDVLVASHTYDFFARPLSTYSYGSLRGLRIEGYRSNSDACDCFEPLMSGTRLVLCRS